MSGDPYLHRRFGVRLAAGVAVLGAVGAVLFAVGGRWWLAVAPALTCVAMVFLARALLRPEARDAEERARRRAGLD
ncbi:MAG TPA: hypothetical protein VM290_09755 [Gaiellaceae bacterium]|jgi:CHASE2 domain-containing sensor protein|nr:hypothetical protein [Gaiellaceae bacterium]